MLWWECELYHSLQRNGISSASFLRKLVDVDADHSQQCIYTQTLRTKILIQHTHIHYLPKQGLVLSLTLPPPS